MNTASTLVGHDDSMRPSLEFLRQHDVAECPAARESSVALAQVRHLPPTRAARLTRSRGLFLGASTHSRLGRWIVNGLCIVVAAVSIVVSAEFAEPVFNTKFVSGNAGPALFASTMRAPAFVASRPR
jgi:hypothetical protein